MTRESSRQQAVFLVTLAVVPLIAWLSGGNALAADRTMRVQFGHGREVAVEIQPEGRPALEFRWDGQNRWVFRGDTKALVGKPYTIRLENRTDERLKVVVAVDGLNAFFRRPLHGRASEDVGAILDPHAGRTLKGWQVDEHEAQQFVFSPPEWSEGARRAAPEVGRIAIHVYQEWQPRRGGWGEKEAAPQAQAARPPIGTTAGEDVGSEVRRVKFVAATEEPAAGAEIVYGQPMEQRPPDVDTRPHGTRLGVTFVETDAGLRITRVDRDSLADDAGLRVDDIITKVDSEDELDGDTVRDIVKGKRPGEYMFLEVRRHHHELTFKIRF
jgi:hypothetical protein